MLLNASWGTSVWCMAVCEVVVQTSHSYLPFQRCTGMVYITRKHIFMHASCKALDACIREFDICIDRHVFALGHDTYSKVLLCLYRSFQVLASV